METTDLSEAIREIQKTALEAAGPQIVNVECGDGAEGSFELPVVLLSGPDGSKTALSLLPQLQAGEAYAEQQRLAHADGPDRRTGTADHQALNSFIAHANRFKAENSAVWADAAGRKLVSVLDYHPTGSASKPLWGKHRGVYPCPLSEAWKAWGGGSPLGFDQEDFASLLDSRDRELASGKLPSGKDAPEPSTLITLANNLEVFSSATAKRERDPNTGRLKISFSEESGVAGAVMPPASFLILVPVFEDGSMQVLEVRLRVTVDKGRALFTVQIHAAGDILRAAFGELCDRVAKDTGLPIFIGTPERV